MICCFAVAASVRRTADLPASARLALASLGTHSRRNVSPTASLTWMAAGAERLSPRGLPPVRKGEACGCPKVPLRRQGVSGATVGAALTSELPARHESMRTGHAHVMPWLCVPDAGHPSRAKYPRESPRFPRILWGKRGDNGGEPSRRDGPPSPRMAAEDDGGERDPAATRQDLDGGVSPTARAEGGAAGWPAARRGAETTCPRSLVGNLATPGSKKRA
jgi:uncharacterized Zn-binding protein involved in type VI secretion